jgi:hypothetical protein
VTRGGNLQKFTQPGPMEGPEFGYKLVEDFDVLWRTWILQTAGTTTKPLLTNWDPQAVGCHEQLESFEDGRNCRRRCPGESAAVPLVRR